MNIGKGREHMCRMHGIRVTHDCMDAGVTKPWMAEGRTMPGAIVENDSGDKVEEKLPRMRMLSSV